MSTPDAKRHPSDADSREFGYDPLAIDEIVVDSGLVSVDGHQTERPGIASPEVEANRRADDDGINVVTYDHRHAAALHQPKGPRQSPGRERHESEFGDAAPGQHGPLDLGAIDSIFADSWYRGFDFD